MSTPNHHPLVELARAAIDLYVREHKRLKRPAKVLPEMQEQTGAFVSLHKGGELRGCIGTITPQRANLAEEIIDNAISAATRDPRFMPVELDELAALESIADQDPKRHGLIVQSQHSQWKRGLLLPDLETIDTAEKQLYYTRVLKAGITDPAEPVELYRFQVKRYH